MGHRLPVSMPILTPSTSVLVTCQEFGSVVSPHLSRIRTFFVQALMIVRARLNRQLTESRWDPRASTSGSSLPMNH